MKTKLILSSFLALASLGSFQAQNTSYTADAIPIPGTGVQNAAFGIGNLTSNSTGWGHSSVGFKALQNNTTGYANSANGSWALQFNTSGYGNTASGSGALNGNTTGFGNTADGAGSLRFTSSGNGNTAVGADALLGNITGDDNSAFGNNANVGSPGLINATAIGANAVALNNDELWLGNAVTQVWTNIMYNISDSRFKSKVDATEVKGLEFIKLLRPVVYDLDAQKLTEFATKNMPESMRKTYLNRDFNAKTNLRQSGFLAQEVETAAKKAGYNFSGVNVPDNENSIYGISYYQFVVPLVKGMQEQQEMIETLKQQVEGLKSELAELRETKPTGINQLNATGEGFKLEQNEPNPFSHETVIKYMLPESTSKAYIAVYDLSGKQITTLPINQKSSSSLTITSEKLAAGIYIYSIVADGKVVDSKRMIVSEK